MCGGERQRLLDVDTSTTARGRRPQCRVDARTAEIGLLQAQPIGARAGQIGPAQHCLTQIGLNQTGFTQPAPGQVHSRRSAPPRTASVKSTSSQSIGRRRQFSNVDPSMLQLRKVLCHNVVRKNRQLRNADP